MNVKTVGLPGKAKHAIIRQACQTCESTGCINGINDIVSCNSGEVKPFLMFVLFTSTSKLLKCYASFSYNFKKLNTI